MKLICPYCNHECETESELQDGQHVVCPFCGQKFSYRSTITATSQESTINRIMAVCPYCGFGEQVNAQYAGQVGSCSKCSGEFTIMANERGTPFAPHANPESDKPIQTREGEKKLTVGKILQLSLIPLALLLAMLWFASGFASPAYWLFLADQRWVSDQLGNEYHVCCYIGRGNLNDMTVSRVRDGIVLSPQTIDKIREVQRHGSGVWPSHVFGEEISFRLNEKTGEVKILSGRKPFYWDDAFMRKLIRRYGRAFTYRCRHPRSEYKMSDEPHTINPVFIKAR